jgi:hypothetical protein
MKRFVEGQERSQLFLLPDCLDDYVGEDNPVRIVDAFIDELDLVVLGFAGVIPEATGRPAYHPSTLLKIYLYGYLNRVQSSRRLERTPISLCDSVLGGLFQRLTNVATAFDLIDAETAALVEWLVDAERAALVERLVDAEPAALVERLVDAEPAALVERLVDAESATPAEWLIEKPASIDRVGGQNAKQRDTHRTTFA